MVTFMVWPLQLWYPFDRRPDALRINSGHGDEEIKILLPAERRSFSP
jgi:hypothetical protein